MNFTIIFSSYGKTTFFKIYNNLTVLETQKEQMTYYKVIRTN